MLQLQVSSITRFRLGRIIIIIIKMSKTLRPRRRPLRLTLTGRALTLTGRALILTSRVRRSTTLPTWTIILIPIILLVV